MSSVDWIKDLPVAHRGYHDMNHGNRPLEEDFQGWDWARGTTADGRTVLLDGRQVCSCLVAMGQIEGRTVETVEGLAFLAYPTDRAAYGHLCRLISAGRMRTRVASSQSPDSPRTTSRWPS